MISFDTVREIAGGLPGAVEGTSYGTPAFHVGKTLFVRQHQDGESLVVRIEPEETSEEEWLSVLLAVGAGGARYFQSCTPSFYNSEQQTIDARAARNLTYSGSLLDYIGYLERWRQDPDFTGVKVRRAGATDKS